MSRFYLLLLFWVVAACVEVSANPINFSKNTTGTFVPVMDGVEHQARVLADTIPPTIICPPSDTFALASGLCDSIYTYSVTAQDSQMMLVPSQLSGLPSGANFPIGTTVNSFLATDTSGNTAACSFSVVIEPATMALNCRMDTILLHLGANCMVALDPATALDTPYGCLFDFELEYDQVAPFGDGPWAPAVFDNTHRDKILGFRVSSMSTGERCFGFVEVRDSTPPAIDCPVVEVPCALPTAHLSPEFLSDSLGISGGMPAISDNCPGNLSIAHIDVNMDVPCDSPGNVTNVITRFWTVLDASNNVATCVQTINRVRAIDDVLFPADVTVSCAMDTLPETTGAPFIQLGNYQYSLLSAPFCELAATFSDSIEMQCGGSLRLYRTWEVRDACLPDTVMNSVSGLQEIVIQDDLEPTVHCPSDTIIQQLVTGCKDTIDLPDLIVSDACSYVVDVQAFWVVDGVPDTLTATLGDFPGNDPAASDTLAIFGLAPNFPVGATDIRFLATDACGNTSSCEMQLVVWDSIPPTAICDSIQVVYLDELGQASLPAGIADDGSSDACTDVDFKIKRQLPGNCDTLGDAFNDLINFCCEDVNDTLLLVLRVYDVPVPAGAVANATALGQFSDCSLPVVVLDLNDPQCEAPEDTTVLCVDFNPDLGVYGMPINSCKMDSMAILLDLQQFDTLCKQGTITRTFQVFDAQGNSGQCTQTITVENQQHYFIRFPDDLFITMCDTSGQYGKPLLTGIDCEKMTVSFSDTVITAVPDACLKIERTWTIINGCTYDPAQSLIEVPNPEPHPLSIHSSNLPGPTVSAPGTSAPWAPTLVKISSDDPDSTDYSMFWDADANGYIYKQVIKIIDIEQPEFIDCPDSLIVFIDSTINDFFLWNANYTPDVSNPKQDLCEGAVDLSITVTDACFGSDLGVDFVLFLDIDGDGTQETEVNSNDLPTAGSVNYFNINNPNFPNGFARPFDHRPVVPNDKYRFATQTTIDGRFRTVHLIWNTANAPTAFLPPQLPLGEHSIRWTIYDGCGNENSCTMNFKVEDPDGTCTPAEVVINGTTKTEAGDGIANVAIQLDGTHPSLPAFTLFDLTDTDGKFNFSVPTSASYAITPFRDDDHGNGVSTFDLLLINKHVLGVTPFGSPYKIIAADANKSNSVTTFDIVELRKLVLGLYDQLPKNTAWRFVPVGHSFIDPDNPFQNGFPEIQIVNNLQQNNLPMHDFIGIKIGDVNGNAIPDIADQQIDDRTGPTLFFDLPDHTFELGDMIQVPIRAAEQIEGFQLTLNFPDLEFVDLEPGPGLSAENFAVFADEQSLTASWDGKSRPEFTLHFRAERAGKLSDLLQLSNRITRSEGYSESLEIMPLALRFDDAGVSRPGFELFQNIPNPFNEKTGIGFYLPEAKNATLRIWDAQGRLLFSHTAFYEKGRQSVLVDRSELGEGPGLLYYELRTDTERAVRKMAVQ